LQIPDKRGRDERRRAAEHGLTDVLPDGHAAESGDFYGTAGAGAVFFFADFFFRRMSVIRN
jgi:hypothetical protein